MTAINITVPATTENLGAGFDCIGAALTLYNQFKFTPIDSGFNISVSGLEAQKVSTDDSNLAYQSFVKFYQQRGEKTPPVNIEIKLDVPLSRGLGSSATAIVGGLMGANYLAGLPLNLEEIIEMAIAIEGHPDNVVPALLGGCRLVASGDSWAICDVPWHESIIPVVAIPDFELSTAEARRVLPNQVSRADAIFNTAHLGLLIRALQTGRADWLTVALQDRLHQPYRQALIHGFEAVQTAAMNAGALGLVISGAGPTLLALVDKIQAAKVESAIFSAWQSAGIKVDVRSLNLDSQGAKADVI